MRKYYFRRQARSAKTGRFVTLAWAKRHPSTTVIETIRVRNAWSTLRVRKTSQ